MNDGMTVAEPVWVCSVCGKDLGDHATVASGDCVECEQVVCENHFGAYDEERAEVTCTRCVEAGLNR
jgi:hypothetical protein